MKSLLKFSQNLFRKNLKQIQKRTIAFSRTKLQNNNDDENDADYENLLKETGVNLNLLKGNLFVGTSTADLNAKSSTSSYFGHNIFVIHPKIRWGKASAPINTTPELQLEEAVSLVRTLPGFNVVT